MKLKNNVFLVFLLTVTSTLWLACGAGVGDTSEDLGSGYTYRSDGGNRWIYFEDSFVNGIDGNVLNYKFNQDYIFATQEPTEKYYKL